MSPVMLLDSAATVTRAAANVARRLVSRCPSNPFVRTIDSTTVSQMRCVALLRFMTNVMTSLPQPAAMGVAPTAIRPADSVAPALPKFALRRSNVA